MKSSALTLAACLFLSVLLPLRAETNSSLQEKAVWTEAAPKAEGEPGFVAFRKTFTLAQKPATAELHLFADVRYSLWVNGRYVLRGPVRFDPKSPEYDFLDITSHLQPGLNSLAIQVMSRASNGQMMRHAPGLAVKLQLSDKAGNKHSITTDESWRWNDKTAYLPPQVRWGIWNDRVDARIEDGGWTQLQFDDSNWKTALKIDGGTWGAFQPRTMPLLRETPVTAKPVGNDTYPVTIANGQEAIFDTGKMVQGYLVVELEAQEGSELEIELAQRFDGKKASDTYGAKNLYTARAGKQTYTSTASYGCRYIAISTKSGGASVLSVTLVDRRYPYEDAGQFTCSDPFLNDLWQRAVHTVRICSEDGFMDCALREKAEWMGDAAVVEYPVSRVTLAGPGAPLKSDAGLMKSMIRHIAQSQTPDGRLKAHHPSDRWDKHGYIEDYSCLWVQTVRQVYDNTADKALVQEVWSALVKQMQWFLDHRTARGLVNAREFVIFDNPLKYKTCEGATLNAFVYRALLDSAYLGDILGEAKQSDQYREAAGQLAKNFNEHLWNEQLGTYNAAIMEEKPVDPTTHAALLALNRGIVPEDRRASVSKYLHANAGKVGMPYTHFWLFEEQYRCDTPEHDLAALHGMRTKWADVMKRTDTGTLTEGYNSGEACHNFGAVPAYFLSSYVLGVRLNGPATNQHLLIEPHLGDLTHAEGVVVTELGLVPVSWKNDSGKLTFSVTVPPDTTATLRVPKPAKNAELLINGKPRPVRASGRYLELELLAGRHDGVVILRR